jgi:hypothetical protein
VHRINVRILIIALGRFELPSEAPKASMIGRYTTGLYPIVLVRRTIGLLFKSTYLCLMFDCTVATRAKTHYVE